MTKFVIWRAFVLMRARFSICSPTFISPSFFSTFSQLYSASLCCFHLRETSQQLPQVTAHIGTVQPRSLPPGIHPMPDPRRYQIAQRRTTRSQYIFQKKTCPSAFVSLQRAVNYSGKCTPLKNLSVPADPTCRCVPVSRQAAA